MDPDEPPVRRRLPRIPGRDPWWPDSANTGWAARSGDKATPPPEEEKDRGKKTVNGIELRDVFENFRTTITREVKELEDLGDRVLFLGSRPCNSMIVAAGDVSRCEKNFLYFFDVHHEIGRNPRAVNLFGNVCKFNLADGIVKFDSRFEWPASLPWWITPNLRKMP